MATIALYSSKINQMPGLFNETKKSVSSLKSELLAFKSKAMAVNQNICDLNDVISTIQASTNIQEEKMFSIEQVKDSIEQFVEDTNVIDGNVADLINRRKDDFYEQYYYLKPECEKSFGEKIKNGLKKACEWCKDHWKEILYVAIAVFVVVTTVVIGGFLTVGAAISLVLKGALECAIFCSIMGGLSSIAEGEPFFDGFF
ncbi:MAG: hypothetical protein PUC65_01290 [Clostridiales bacterium]|nr:hypothetical protein [Clostridiales bacterium]